MTHWATVRSFGSFVYFDENIPARALLEELVTRMNVEKISKVSTKNYSLTWKKFSWKTVDEAIENGSTLSIAILVGTPQDVRLGGKIALRLDTDFEARFQSPLTAWIGAESETWPESQFIELGKHWLRIAASQGKPLSGGVLAAATLKNAKVEMTHEFETDPGEVPDRSPRSFRGKMELERPPTETREKIRRVYPITLLGPKFATQFDDAQLAAAGATNIERVNGSVIFDATSKLIEAWSPEYLAATVELRRLLWPMSFQNPADAPDAKRRR